jgi:hypothetical protein
VLAQTFPASKAVHDFGLCQVQFDGTLTAHAPALPCDGAGPYSTYEGSPVSKGILQPDMWGVKPSDRWDWAQLRRDIAQVRQHIRLELHSRACKVSDVVTF